MSEQPLPFCKSPFCEKRLPFFIHLTDCTVPLLKKLVVKDLRIKPVRRCEFCNKEIHCGHFNCKQCALLLMNDPLAFLVTVSVQGILTWAMAYITSTNSYGKRPIKTITIKKIPKITQERMLRKDKNTIFIGEKHYTLKLRKNNDGFYSGKFN